MSGGLEREETVPRVCAGCRFGSGLQRTCTLVAAGRIDVLVEEGACDIGGRIRSIVDEQVTAYSPGSANLAGILAEKALFRFQLEGQGPPPELDRLPRLEAWLERWVRAFALDVLAREGAIAAPRCGSCRHGGGGSCRLELVEGAAGELVAHPHFGRDTAGDLDPRVLDPACDRFEFPAAPEVDPLDEALAGRGTEDPTRRVLETLDAMAEEGDRNLACVVVLQRLELQGRSVEEVARSTGYAEEVVVALRDEGRRELRRRLGPVGSSGASSS